MTIPNDQEAIDEMACKDAPPCPFCGEKDFDFYGLKLHFQRGWCDVYNQLEAPKFELRNGL